MASSRLRGDHDPRQEVPSRVLAAELLELPSGDLGLHVRIAFPSEYEDAIRSLNGLSVTAIEQGVPGWESPSEPDVELQVDNYHWDNGEIVDALQAVAQHGLRIG